jgi:maleate isomerase
VIATATAMVDVLSHEGVTETAVVTPYLKPVNDGLRTYLEAADISVEVIHSRECRTVEELGRLGEDDVFDMVLNAVTPTTHSVFVACSQLPTLGILEPLRERLGIPVWSSVSATAWACRRALAGSVASGAP